MSVGLATKGMISFGGGGTGAGEPYPVYEYVHYEVEMELEDELGVVMAVEEVSLDVIEIGGEEAISIEVSDVSLAIDFEPDEVDIGVELETSAETRFWYQPYSMTVQEGTLACGGLTNLHADDGDRMQVNEIAGQNFTIILTFIGVPVAERTVNIKGNYDGNPAHNVKLQVYNFDSVSWDNFTGDSTDFPSQVGEGSYQFTLPTPYADYISDGEMRIRIRHTSNGSAGHEMYLDHLYLG